MNHQPDVDAVAVVAAPRAAVDHDLFSEPDDQRYYNLPAKCKQEARLWLRIFKQIASSSNVQQTCRRLATVTFAGVRGFSEHRIRTMFYAWRRSGCDWEVLIDWAKAGATARAIRDGRTPSDTLDARPAFIQFWKKLCEDNQRNGGFKTAHKELRAIYKTRFATARTGYKEYKVIPGYEDGWPDPDPHTGLPPGWTYSNLSRDKYTPDNFERKAARQGKAAAAVHRRKVFTVRIDPLTGKALQFGAFVLFDDQQYDLKVNFLSKEGHAQRQAMRPLGFNALELLSASCFKQCFKPTVWDENADARKMLTERDFLWFFVDYVTTVGYRADIGTRAVLELGTTAIKNKHVREQIERLTHGKLILDESTIDAGPAFAGLFDSQGKGNFRFKAALESFFNLLRNEMGFLIGATGKDRNHCPAELHGRDKYNEQMFRLAAKLPPERAALLQHPFLEWNQFIGLALDIYRLIDDRTDHSLEGWAQLGFVSNEWRLPCSADFQSAVSQTSSLPWLPMQDFLAMPEPARLAMQTYFDRDPSLTRTRQLSPREVFGRHASVLTRLPEYMILDLLGEDIAQPVERTVRDGYITIKDHEVSPEPMRFIAELDGRSLRNGTKYNCLLNDFNPTRLHLYNAQNGYVCTIPRDFAPVRSDYEAVKRKMADAKRDENNRLVQLGIRHQDRAQDKAAMHEHNARVASGAPVTPEELEREAAHRQAAKLGRAIEGARASSPAAISDEPTETITI